MNAQEIQARLKAQFGDAVGELSEAKIDPFVTVKAEKIVELANLRGRGGAGFRLLRDVTGIDWRRATDRGRVSPVLAAARHQIVLKVQADRSQPSVPSVQGVWKQPTGWNASLRHARGEFAATRTCGASCCPTTG